VVDTGIAALKQAVYSVAVIMLGVAKRAIPTRTPARGMGTSGRHASWLAIAAIRSSPPSTTTDVLVT
jgi:hypothetical protein